MRAQAWRTIRISTQAVAVLATLLLVPAFTQADDQHATRAPAELSEREVSLDLATRATLRGLSLESQLPAYVVVAHDPQWSAAGATVRVSPPVRATRTQGVPWQAKAMAAMRVVADAIRALHPSEQTVARSPRRRPLAPLHDLREPTPAELEHVPWVFADLGASPAGCSAPDDPSRWLWSPLPITGMTSCHAGHDRRVDWAPWRPRGPPAVRPQLSQRRIQLSAPMEFGKGFGGKGS